MQDAGRFSGTHLQSVLEPAITAAVAWIMATDTIEPQLAGHRATYARRWELTAAHRAGMLNEAIIRTEGQGTEPVRRAIAHWAGVVSNFHFVPHEVVFRRGLTDKILEEVRRFGVLASELTEGGHSRWDKM